MEKNDNVDLQRIGRRLQELRKAKGYSNYEYFAFEHSIPRAQYGRYEKGQDMRLSSFFKVLRALEVTPVEFFSTGFEEEK
ncbi:MAG: helix-turn-helix transcriptional regulator [Cyanobacteria bacterium J06600_6]